MVPPAIILEDALIIPATSNVYAGVLQLIPTLQLSTVVGPAPTEVTTRLPFTRIVDAVLRIPSLPILRALEMTAGGGSIFKGQIEPSGAISTTNPPADKTRTRSGPHELDPELSPLNIRSSESSSGA